MTSISWLADLEKNTPRTDSVMISNGVLQDTAAEVTRLRETIKACAERFREYEQALLEKGMEEVHLFAEARKNAEMAEMCEEVLNRT